jgi:molybdenum cofactor biosynthesis enzyme MoaA
VAAERAFDPGRIIEILDRHHVEYILVGGFAAQAHGAHRQTLDVDVVPRTTDLDLERLGTALRDLGARLRVGGMTDEEARQLPVTVDITTLCNFVNSTWTTGAGPLDVLGTSRHRPDRAPATTCSGVQCHVACMAS